MEETIKFQTGCFGHEVACYLKENGYDVYLNHQCIMQKATLQWCLMLQTLLTKME